MHFHGISICIKHNFSVIWEVAIHRHDSNGFYQFGKELNDGKYPSINEVQLESYPKILINFSETLTIEATNIFHSNLTTTPDTRCHWIENFALQTTSSNTEKFFISCKSHVPLIHIKHTINVIWSHVICVLIILGGWIAPGFRIQGIVITFATS